MIRIPSRNANPLLKSQKTTFKKDVLDLFLGLKTAHLSSYTFEYGSHLWEDFFNAPSDYYVVKDEINLIKENLTAIRRICAGVRSVVDFGPGSSRAVENKTLPVLKALMFSLEDYYAVDVCGDYLRAADRIVGAAFPQLNNHLLHQDFFGALDLPVGHRSLGLLFGLTLSNMPGIYDKESGINYLRREMQTFRGILPQGAYFLCSYDTCQDAEKMMRAYDHPKHAAFIKSITSKIKSNLLPDSGFEEDAWFYNPAWDKKNHMFRHVLTSKKPMSFTLSGHSFLIPEKYDILSYMSVKFPEEIYLRIFKESGFELATKPFKGPGGDINISLLKAI